MKPRFVTEDQLNDLICNYRIAKVHFAGTAEDTRYNRVKWAVAEYTKVNPGVTHTDAYKDLDTFTNLYLFA